MGIYNEMPRLRTKPLTLEALQWLENRYFGWHNIPGIMETDYPGDTWGWNKRIYIPVYENGSLVSAVTRGYCQGAKAPKYLSGPKAGQDGLVYDINDGSPTTAVLVEGVFDAAAIPPPYRGIATFGVEMVPAQIAALISKGIAECIILYDYDRCSKALRVQQLIESWGITSVVASHEMEGIPTHKGEGKVDPASMSPWPLKVILDRAAKRLEDRKSPWY